jgi:hypothetical protein
MPDSEAATKMLDTIPYHQSTVCAVHTAGFLNCLLVSTMFQAVKRTQPPQLLHLVLQFLHITPV